MVLTIAICDDEKQQLQYLEKLVLDWGREQAFSMNVLKFDSAETFRFEWEVNKEIDILLLDIEMGGQNGVDLAKWIRQSDQTLNIVFITGLSEYIEEGYEVNALHYLMKPVKELKLHQVLSRAVANRQKQETYLILNNEGEQIKLLQKDIFALEAMGHHTYIYTKNEKYETKVSISKVLDALEMACFVKCHRSYSVGIRHIQRITKSDVVLDNQQHIPLSRRLYKQVNEAFIQYFKGGSL